MMYSPLYMGENIFYYSGRQLLQNILQKYFSVGRERVHWERMG